MFSQPRPSRIASIFVAVAVIFFNVATPAAARTPPANDDFADAQVVTGASFSVSGNNLEATEEIGELQLRHTANSGSATVWYRWEAPAGLPRHAVLTTAGSEVETEVAVYMGDSLEDLTLVASGPFDGGLRGGATPYTEVSFEAVPGQTYRIVVANRSGSGAGNFQLRLNPALHNDDFAFWQEVVGSSGTLRGSNVGATLVAGEHDHAGNAGGRSVWFRWRAPVSGTTTLTTAGSGFDTLLAVYTDVAALTPVVSNDDDPAAGDSTSRVEVEAVAGTDYFIAIDGFNGAAGDFALNLSAPQPVANDNIANAEVLSGPFGSVIGSNIGATREIGEYVHALNRSDHSVWYTWTPEADGDVIFTTEGSNFNTVLAVYTSLGGDETSAGTLKEVVSNREAVFGAQHSLVSFEAAAGTKYFIVVEEDFFSEPGNLTLRWGAPVSISGVVSDIAGDLVSAVLTLSDGNTERTFDVFGFYTIEGLIAGTNYTLRAESRPGEPFLGFSPDVREFTPLTADVVDANFEVVVPTHTVTGRIIFPAGADLSTVTVELSGNASRTATLGNGLDPDGNYTFQGLTTRGFYHVTPSSQNFTFDPPSKPTGKLVSDLELLPITATPVVNHTISGRVLVGAAGQNGVVVELRDAFGAVLRTATTAGAGAAAGSYSFAGVRGGETYAVAPAASNIFNFTPTSIPLPNLSATKSGQNFTATRKTYSIGGRVLVGAAGEDGVVLQLKDAAGQVVKTATTATVGGVKGTYSFTGVAAGLNYTVVPAPSAAFSFTPASIPITNLSADQAGRNFAATRKTYNIGGRVLLGTVGQNGVAVQLKNSSGAVLQTATTAGSGAAAGSYSFTGLAAGASYTVAPAASNIFNFTPASIPFPNLSADQAGKNFNATRKTYTISGRVLAGTAGLNGVGVQLRDGSGAVLQTVTTAGAGTAAGFYSFAGVAAGLSYAVVPAPSAVLSFAPLSIPIPNLSANQTGKNFNASSVGPKLRLSAATYNAAEGVNKSVLITVVRAGDMTRPAATVGYRTSDGTASERSDYTTATGTLRFAAGEESKSFSVLLTNDVYDEELETFNVTLSAPTGAALDTQASATVRVSDNDAASGPSPVRAQFFDAAFFVRQHYLDFFSREPGAGGLAFWTKGLTDCGANADCLKRKRIDTSAAFFLSIEFQETGYLIYRFYKAAYGDATSPGVAGTVPVIRFQEFLPDVQRIGEGVAVHTPGWEEKLEANKRAFALTFVGRSRFLAAYPLSLSPTQFVGRLNSRAGGVLTAAQRAQLIAQLTADNTTAGRAAVVRAVAENELLRRREFNRAFVLMQYYGYLRRNPDDGGARSFAGWKGWLDKLERFGGDYHKAEMVLAFIESIEYGGRFGNP